MKDIKGYEGKYGITEEGFVWGYPKKVRHKSKSGKEGFRSSSGKWLKHYVMKNGYHVVDLYHDTGKKDHFLVHRLVAFAYLEQPEGTREINHKDGNKANNKVENLEWITSKGNKKHAWEMGLYTHNGQRSHAAKLTDEKAKEILYKYAECDGEWGKITKLAKEYGVTSTVISRIVNLKGWKHILDK